jgi:hypothetical protein
MGALRDWRSAFEQLERERGDHAPPLPDNLPFMLNGSDPASALPPELALPPAKKPKAPPKKAKAPVRKKAAARKADAPKVKAPARKRKAAAAKPKQEKAAKAASKPRAPRTRKPIEAEVVLPTIAAIALPADPEPLAELPDLTAPEPLARGASPATWRKQGLADAIGYWLRHTTRRAGAKLGFAGFRSGRRKLDALEAENAELRRQLEALHALNDAAQFRFQD